MAEAGLKSKQVAVIVVLGILGVGLYAMGSGTSIDQYRPTSRDESRIIDLLARFQKAKKQYNLEAYLSCLADQGQFMFAGTRMVSKQELEQRLPSFWARIKAGGPGAAPSSREELNGNYLDGAFYDPVIEIHPPHARAVLTFATPVVKWKTKLFLKFRKDRDSWKISRFEWDMG